MTPWANGAFIKYTWHNNVPLAYNGNRAISWRYCTTQIIQPKPVIHAGWRINFCLYTCHSSAGFLCSCTKMKDYPTDAENTTMRSCYNVIDFLKNFPHGHGGGGGGEVVRGVGIRVEIWSVLYDLNWGFIWSAFIIVSVTDYRVTIGPWMKWSDCSYKGISSYVSKQNVWT